MSPLVKLSEKTQMKNKRVGTWKNFQLYIHHNQPLYTQKYKNFSFDEI